MPFRECIILFPYLNWQASRNTYRAGVVTLFQYFVTQKSNEVQVESTLLENYLSKK